MRTVVEFERDGEDTSPRVFVPVEEPRGRPRLRYRLRVNTKEEVEMARARRVPLFWFDSTLVSDFGYPLEFSPRVMVANSIAEGVETRRQRMVWNSSSALLSPRMEDVAVWLLKVDPVGSHVILDYHRDRMDDSYVARRVREEGLVEEASFARLFDVAPSVPKMDHPMSRAFVERKIRASHPRVRL